MPKFRVSFIMDVDANTAVEAAYEVGETLADGDPYMGQYDVLDYSNGMSYLIQPGTEG